MGGAVAQDELLLSLAGGMAQRVVEVVSREGLECGILQEAIKVGEHEFMVSCHHHKNSGLVLIQGAPVIEIEPGDVGEMLQRLMTGGGDEGQAGSFDFRVPVAWLPQLTVDK